MNHRLTTHVVCVCVVYMYVCRLGVHVACATHVQFYWYVHVHASVLAVLQNTYACMRYYAAGCMLFALMSFVAYALCTCIYPFMCAY